MPPLKPLFISAAVTQHIEDAAALRNLRSVLLRAPHVELHRLARLDERMAAHLDGAFVAGDDGYHLAQAVLEQPGLGQLFVAAVLAIERRDLEQIERLLALVGVLPEATRALTSAFGWVSPGTLPGITKTLLESANLFHRDVGLAACAMHQVDPEPALASAIAESANSTQAVVAAGKLGRVDLLSACLAGITNDDGNLQFESTRSSLLLGDRTASVQKLVEFGLVAGEHQAPALSLALKVLAAAPANALLKTLSQDASMVRALIRGIGAAGDPHYVPWLIQQMNDLKLTRLAGESFSLITGLDLAALDLERKPPGNEEFGPNDNPDDDNVAMDEDDSLPWPEPDKIGAWWQTHGARFVPGTRYFVGAPPSPVHCLSVLKTGFQRQRIAAAEYLCLLQPGTPLFKVAAPAWRQERLLAQMGT